MCEACFVFVLPSSDCNCIIEWCITLSSTKMTSQHLLGETFITHKYVFVPSKCEKLSLEQKLISYEKIISFLFFSEGLPDTDLLGRIGFEPSGQRSVITASTPPRVIASRPLSSCHCPSSSSGQSLPLSGPSKYKNHTAFLQSCCSTMCHMTSSGQSMKLSNVQCHIRL